VLQTSSGASKWPFDEAREKRQAAEQNSFGGSNLLASNGYDYYTLILEKIFFFVIRFLSQYHAVLNVFFNNFLDVWMVHLFGCVLSVVFR
jgi:hypothetical protein